MDRTGTLGRPMRLAATIVLVLAVAACTGGGDDASEAGDTDTTVTGGAPEPLAVDDVPVPAEGQARLALGGSLDLTLPVERCVLDLAAQPDGQIPSEQVTVVARGATPDGQPLMVDIRRFRSEGASPTITDTIRVVEGPEDAPVRVLEAQRFEVEGLVTDPRDPEADDPLLRVADRRIDARGVFAPPGSFADDGGLVEGAVSVTCAP